MLSTTAVARKTTTNVNAPSESSVINCRDSNEARLRYERHAFRTTKGPEERLAATLPVREGRGAYNTTGTRDATLTPDDYYMMSWTACYDDEYYTHIGDKQGSGWFPTRKSRSVCFSRGGPDPLT
jgi:hypothetical protein